jgi:hypothetical protein
MLLQVSANRCGHSVQRWLGTININMKVMVKLVVSMKTPRSGVSGLVDDEVGDIGGKVGGVDTSVQCVDYCLR